MNPTILLDHDAPAADGSQTVRALLTLEGAAPADQGRVPLNLSLVLDRSGSMAGEKLRAATRAASDLVRRLWPDDLVSVVAYDDEVAVVAMPSRSSDAVNLSGRITAIPPGGSTNLSGGWLKGQELTASRRQSNGVNRVILLTDGLANVGIQDLPTLAGLCRTAAEGGVTTTTVGFGVGFDEKLLRAMADAGRGNTYYIETADQASGIFDEELSGLLSLTAQNLSVEIRLAGGALLAAIHHSYPRQDVVGGLQLQLGDLYAREPKRLLVEFRVPAGLLHASIFQLGTLVIRGDVLTAGGGLERREITCPVQFVPGEGPRAEPEVRKELLLVETARAREEALDRSRRGDHAGASLVLRCAAGALRDADFDDDRLQDEMQDLQTLSEMGSAPMSPADQKYIFQRAHDATRSKPASSKRDRTVQP